MTYSRSCHNFGTVSAIRREEAAERYLQTIHCTRDTELDSEDFSLRHQLPSCLLNRRRQRELTANMKINH